MFLCGAESILLKDVDALLQESTLALLWKEESRVYLQEKTQEEEK